MLLREDNPSFMFRAGTWLATLVSSAHIVHMAEFPLALATFAVCKNHRIKPVLVALDQGADIAFTVFLSHHSRTMGPLVVRWTDGFETNVIVADVDEAAFYRYSSSSEVP